MSTSGFVREHSESLEKAARAGYSARGLVFLIIGYFAFRSAFATGKTMGSQDAVKEIFGAGFGAVLLWILVVSLIGFAVWRVIQAWYDVDGQGTDAKGLAIRTALFGSALAYGALAFYAGSLAAGYGSGSSGSAGSGLISQAYQAGFGQWLTYLIALVMVGVGAAHIIKGSKAGFEKYMRIPGRIRGWLKPLCQFGLIARGLTFFVIALLLFRGAGSYSGSGTPGLEAALDAIASWSFGWLLLSLTGLGLIAFGAYAIAEAIYRRINIDQAS